MNQLEVCRKWHGKTQFLAFCLKNHFSHVQDHLLSFLQCILVPFSDTSLNQYVHFWGFQVKAKIQETSPKKVSIFLLCKAFSGWNSATKIYPSQLWIQNLDFFVTFSPFVKVKFPLRFWHSSSKASSGLVSSLTWFLWLPRNLEAENPTENPLNIKPSGAHNTRCFFLLSLYVFDQRPHKWVFGRTLVGGKYDTSLVSKRTLFPRGFPLQNHYPMKDSFTFAGLGITDPIEIAPKMLPMALMDLLPLKHPSTSK